MGSLLLRPAPPRRVVQCGDFSWGAGKFGAPHAPKCTLGGEGRGEGHKSGVAVNREYDGNGRGRQGVWGRGVGSQWCTCPGMKLGGQGQGWGQGKTSLR